MSLFVMFCLNLLLRDVSLHVIFFWIILFVLVKRSKVKTLSLFCIPVGRIESWTFNFFRCCIISKSQDKFFHIFESIFKVAFMIISSTSEGVIYKTLFAIRYQFCNLKNVKIIPRGVLLLVTIPHFSSFIP